MSVLVRGGSLALLLGLMLAAPAARAESSPAWTDPPVRGNAGAQGATTPGATEVKPAAAKPEAATPPETKPAEARSQEGRPGPGQADGKATERSASTAPPAAAPASKAVPSRAGFQGISPYRRPLVRSWPVARAPVLRQRAAEAPRREMRRPVVERRLAQRDETRGLRRRRDVAGGFGYRPVERFEPAPRRMAGWGGLNDERAERMAQARAMGYRVMRMRTYEFPDGRRVQELMPLGGPDDLD